MHHGECLKSILKNERLLKFQNFRRVIMVHMLAFNIFKAFWLWWVCYDAVNNLKTFISTTTCVWINWKIKGNSMPLVYISNFASFYAFHLFLQFRYYPKVPNTVYLCLVICNILFSNFLRNEYALVYDKAIALSPSTSFKIV